MVVNYFYWPEYSERDSDQQPVDGGSGLALKTESLTQYPCNRINMSSSVDDVDDDYDALESDQSDVGTRAARYEHNFTNAYILLIHLQCARIATVTMCSTFESFLF